MQKTTITKLGGQDLIYCQYATLEEAQKSGLPKGTYFFWEYNGERIYSPGEVVSLIIMHSQAGKLETTNLLSPVNLKKYYDNLHQIQKKNVVTQFKQARENISKDANTPDDIKKVINSTLNNNINVFEGSPSPHLDLFGIFKPTREQACSLLGGEENLNKYLTPEQQTDLFGEE